MSFYIAINWAKIKKYDENLSKVLDKRRNIK